MPIIEVKNLSKQFTFYKKEEGLKGSFKALFNRKLETKEAVKNISFSIEKGEFVGFIGPNGAGKTTTLKMLSGILYPTSGEIIVSGFEPKNRQDEFKKKISIVMGQKSQLTSTIPAIETFNLIQKMYEVDETSFCNKVKELSELMEVTDVLNIQVRKLSLGQRMKCELIASLLHEPEILFLDEPTIGLDVSSQKKIREFLKDYNKRKQTTIILTSHYMDDVESLCERIIVINNGEIGYDGSLKKVVEEFSQEKRVLVKFDDRVFKKDLVDLGKIITFSSYEVELSVSSDKLKKILSILIEKFSIRDLNIVGVALEDVVEDIFRGK